MTTVAIVLRIAEEVTAALTDGRPVVALESTLLAHGLPSDRALTVGRRLEELVRAGGAVPATVAVLDGHAQVGLSPAQLEQLCDPDIALAKLSLRDIGPAIALGTDGATTVASTAALAHRAGIPVFATGGLGGVHRDSTWDVSADLQVLGRTPVLVVSSGVKSILDIPATLEVLETLSVPVLGYRTDGFPAFYRRDSGLPVSFRVDEASQAAAAFAAHRRFDSGGMLVANPVPVEHEMPAGEHDRILAEALDLVARQGTTGKAVTPVLLSHFHYATDGRSVRTNEALVESNVRLGTEIAVALCRQ
ncbi:pseudouridine-5'-phosphate glycosidase [Pseudonocardiaceae bacterium YIM PH 21723]|nr:pseudouridine-5'-phosphate glycosidase [Pseudonocardiaceae bacterium YIM PH 21723]